MAPNTDIATRSLVVTLKSPVGGKSTAEIAEKTGLSKRTINDIYSRAISRGFEPNTLPLTIKDEFLKDAPRSGRPLKQTEEAKQLLVTKVSLDRYAREKSTAELAGDLSAHLNVDISARTIHRMLKGMGYTKTKPTRKPGLTKKMMDERLAWCLQHKDWTLEDWKNVIWTDETSVLLNHRRGSYRVWRTPQEAFLKSTIRERWSGYSEFMFWGCFTYDEKGPCHIYLPETAAEKKKAEEEISVLNAELEPALREQWELITRMGRLGLHNKRGRQPTWRFNAKNGKISRRKGSGVDWYRYQVKVLKPKLIPFAKKCMETRPCTVVQEDKAPAHSHHIQQKVYDANKVARLLWCGNSPDLNAIEPCWFWMKRETTKKGAPKSRADGIRKWEYCWKHQLKQEQIRKWIERIPRHIEEIIRLNGGNEYREGRNHTARDR